MRLDEIGEFGLIERIRSRKSNYDEDVVIGIGDDCAILRRGPVLEVLTTDCLVKGTHYEDDWLSVKDVGWKALAVNVSDVAAVGGIPKHALVTLFLSDGMTAADVDGLYDGLDECGNAFGVSIVGGDIVKIRGPFAISVTLAGTCERDEVVLRSGAREGDLIVVTGALGEAALGMKCLRDGVAAAEGSPLGECVKKFRRPSPRLPASRAIVEALRPSSMIDISDGLLADVRHILEASKVGAELDAEAIPISAGVRDFFKGEEEAVAWAISGGEEYELLFTMSAKKQDKLPELAAKLGIKLTPIGGIIPKSYGVKLKSPNGEKELKPDDMPGGMPGGFDHFKSEGSR
ncbi:MAG TPA: thiamine-phosphate kinase [bacterium]|nr:thiamine-phosphate kinase [bacterium]